MPQATQRRTRPSFEARSVMLFAALTVGGALAQAETPPASSAQPKYQLSPSRVAAAPQAAPGGGARPPAEGPAKPRR